MFNIKNLSMNQLEDNKTLVSKFSAHFDSYDRVVLLGEEGTGKSSFLKVLNRSKIEYVDFEYDSMSENKIIAYVDQKPFYLGSVYNFIYDSSTYINYQKLYSLLDGFNLDESLLGSRLFNTLSGGEKVKLSLIKALLKEADILLLDEPTNDLDLESMRFLENILMTLSIPIVFVSHDIRFIENIANKVIYFEQIKRRTESKITYYNMDYASFTDYRKSQIANQNILAQEERNKLEISLQKIERIHDKVHHALSKEKNDFVGASLKSKMQSIKSHEKKLEKQSDSLTEFVEAEESIKFILNHSHYCHNSKTYIDLELESLKIEDKVLSKSIKLNLTGNQKIALVGKNGVGKSTLLKEVIKNLENSNITYAYMPQNYEDIYNASNSAIEILLKEGDKGDRTEVMNYLGSLRFTFEEMHRPFKKLSGGQKAKLFFADMARNELEILLMDEPTRNLSPLSMEVLIEELTGFKGAVFAVTHDRNLLEQVFDTIYELTPQGLSQISLF